MKKAPSSPIEVIGRALIALIGSEAHASSFLEGRIGILLLTIAEFHRTPLKSRRLQDVLKTLRWFLDDLETDLLRYERLHEREPPVGFYLPSKESIAAAWAVIDAATKGTSSKVLSSARRFTRTLKAPRIPRRRPNRFKERDDDE